MRLRTQGCALAALVLFLQLSTARGAERILLASAEADASSGAISLVNDEALASASAEAQTWVDDEVAFVEPRPLWTVWAGAIFLTRDNPQAGGLVFEGADRLLHSRQLDFGTTAGPDINAIRHGDFFDVDFRYFNVNNLSAHEQLFPSGGTVQLPLIDPLDIQCGPRLAVVGITSIQSVEINARKNVFNRLAFLAGFRYLELDDVLSHRWEFLGLDGRVNLDGLNRLYGAQMGVDGIVFTRGRFQVTSAAKAGIYGNNAQNSLRISIEDSPKIVVSNREQPTAFVGDWNFSGIYAISDHLAIRGGYQLLWFSGVALGSEQHGGLSDSIVPGLDVKTSDLFMHGALVSLQASW